MGHLSSNSQMTLILLLALAIFTSLNLVTAQVITTPCTTSMINTITPCANFITGSINNGLTPSATCCDSFLSLITTSVDCACLLVSANVPLQIPVNRVLALFLPQACNVGQMPALCKGAINCVLLKLQLKMATNFDDLFTFAFPKKTIGYLM